MTNQQPHEVMREMDEADTRGHMIREPREQIIVSPYDRGGGLFPYQFLHPTISNGYILADGSRLPYR